MSTSTSPRIEDGVIKWYEGDAFYLNFAINDLLTKQPIELNENDSITVEFFDCREKILAIFNDIKKNEKGQFTVHIDNKITQRFKVGKYHYKIELHKNNSETIQTIKKCGNAEVEGYCECQT